MAQPDSGLPFVSNFPTSTYRQGPQNFTVLQSNEGLIYVGNNNGLLVYDGVDWNLITITNKSEVHALAQDEDGTMYVGAQGDFGYLHTSDNGDVQYKSLLHLLDSTYRDFNDVWSIHTTNDLVVFRSTKGLYLYNRQAQSIKAIPFNTTRHRSFFIYGEVWVRLEDAGLLRLKKDRLELVPGGELLKSESINAAFDYGNGRTLLISEERGLIIYDGKTFSTLKSAANQLIITQNSFAKLLSNGNYAIGTRTKGLIILDHDGNVLQHIGKKQGLIDESVWSIEEDRFTQNLWIACNNGISLVELGSPFSSFQERSGVNGQFYNLTSHASSFFAAGSLGLFKKEKNNVSASEGFVPFKPINEIGFQAWHLYSDSAILLVSANTGIFSIKNDKLLNIGFNNRAWYLLPLKKFPDYILANTVEGLVLLKKNEGKANVYRKLKYTPESIYYFAEDEDGMIWINSPTRGIYRLDFKNDISADPELSLFTEKDGLPSAFRVRPFELKDEVVFGTEKGLYRFNKEAQRFEFHPTLNKMLFGDTLTWIELLKQDDEGNLWGIYILRTKGKRYSIGFSAQSTEGGYEVKHDIFKRINSLKINDINIIDQNNIYLLTSDGIVHYNPQEKSRSKTPVLIRSVTAIGEDSILSASTLNSIPAELNSLRFHFAGMGFIAPGEMEYSYLLEGFDKRWSEYDVLPQKEYTNLPAGKYIFKVKARSLQNIVSEESALPFSVQLPWYQSAWIYVFYFFGVTILVISIVRWRSNSLRMANQRLEKSIAERTLEITKQHQDILDKNQLLEAQKEEIEASREEIEEANRVIAQQNENLKYVNVNLEKIVESRTGELQNAYKHLLSIKQELDTFIYRSSHDIKGPLTRLLGLCHIAKLDVQDKTALQYINLLEVEINATNRILQKLLVYQRVKDWNLQQEKINLEILVDRALVQLDNLPDFMATQIARNSDDCTIATDAYLLEVALQNVLENAILFSDRRDPKIHIGCHSEQNNLHIQVSDNGRGIEEAISENIFAMFYRGSEKSKGAGLGLFIAKEAITKIGGHIHLKNVPGWNTTFEIILPIQ
jgi:signal transduction histidine kinase